MVSQELTAEGFQISAILAFMRTCELKDPETLGEEYAKDDGFRSHVAFLKTLLSAAEASTIATTNGWQVIGQRDDGVTILQRFDTSEEAMKSNLRDVTRQLTMRIKTNLLAAGVTRELLDVSFDDAAGFHFSLTEKSLRLQASGPEGPNAMQSSRELTLKSIERFGWE